LYPAMIVPGATPTTTEWTFRWYIGNPIERRWTIARPASHLPANIRDCAVNNAITLKRSYRREGPEFR